MIGIDIVDITRMTKAVERHGDRFLEKVFTAEEIKYMKGKRKIGETMAGHFAAKEAFIKAMGRGLPWKDMEVHHEEGRPYIMFRGKCYDNVSISHEHTYAVSVVNIPD
jgi:phosphopantetheine--protein transferase-like protein